MATTLGERVKQTRVTPFFLVVVALLLPVGAVLISMIGSHWHAVADYVFEVINIDDVGTSDTPVVGAYSRFGFDHPGPLLWWVLAPFHWIAGNTGILFGTGVLNGAAIVGSVFVARRRGGVAFSVVIAVIILLLLQGMGTDLLIDPWNPWIPVLPFLAYVLLAWSIAERDFAMLPWLVGVGSFVVQSHIGYLPLVLGLAVVAAVLARTHHDAVEPGALKRWAKVSGIVAIACWIAPVVQQFTGNPGNLGEIFEYFRDPKESALGWAWAFRVMGTELGFPGAWVTGEDTGPTGLVDDSGSGFLALIVLAVAAGLAAVAWRRGERRAARFSVFAVCGAMFGLIAGSRVTGITGPYVVRWWFVLAAMVYASIAWSAWSMTANWWRAQSTGIVRAGRIAIGILVGVFSLVTAVNAVPARVPVEDVSEVIGGLRPQLVEALSRDDSYLVTWIDARTLGDAGTGVFLALREEGFDAHLRQAHAKTVGGDRAAEPEDVDAVVLVVSDYSLLDGWQVPVGAIEIAHYDPLSAEERTRVEELSDELRAQLDEPLPAGPLPVESEDRRNILVKAGADRDLVDDLWNLQKHAGQTVYLVAPEVIGTTGA